MTQIQSLVKSSAFFILTGFLLLSSCVSTKCKQLSLAKINIIDRNGLSQTYSNKDRVDQYASTTFTDPQPYKKVMRVFDRDLEGNISSIITTYHPNGELREYLEIVNGRAFGAYKEWFPNGQKKLEAVVVGGEADIDEKAKQTWLFNNKSLAWDDDGTLAAEIFYVKGKLSGETLYYHKNGSIWKKINFNNGLYNGSFEIYLSDGSLLQKSLYENGAQHGSSVRYWEGTEGSTNLSSVEEFDKGRLISATYFRPNGEVVAEIKEGYGIQARFGKSSIAELVEYKNGEPEGFVKLFSEGERLVRLFHVKDRQKDGVHLEYFNNPIKDHKHDNPKMQINWVKGKIQGTVKTWYSNGQIESQREMSNNKKNGLSTFWYKDGTLMIIEDYSENKLVNGKYMKKGESAPVSKVIKGSGTATLFDGDGSLIRKNTYHEGYPTNS